MDEYQSYFGRLIMTGRSPKLLLLCPVYAEKHVTVRVNRLRNGDRSYYLLLGNLGVGSMREQEPGRVAARLLHTDSGHDPKPSSIFVFHLQIGIL